MKKCLDKRQQMTRSGAPASVLPQCKFFEQMRFLHDKTANKPTESNISHAAMEGSVVSESNSVEPNPATTSVTTTSATSIEVIKVLPQKKIC